MADAAKHHPDLTIHVDGTAYRHAPVQVTPQDIREIPTPNISDAKQIWLDVDDALDELLAEGRATELKDEMHFFSEIPAISITIDRASYQVYKRKMTGTELRTLPSPDVAADRDLWLDVPDKRDRKVQDEDVIHLKDGMRFFTAPGRINPGASISGVVGQ